MSRAVVVIAFTLLLMSASNYLDRHKLYTGVALASNYSEPSITIYFIPPSEQLSWETPRALARTVLKNYLLAFFVGPSHPIGHSAVQISCSKSPDEYDTSTWAAVTGGSVEGDLARFLSGAGFDLLRQDFAGEMINSARTRDDINLNLSKGTVRWITIKLSSESCEREVRYYSRFVAKGIYKRFGASGHPRDLTGAGCTSFSLSFLDVVGLRLPMARFERQLHVPIDLFRSEMNKPIYPWELLVTSYPNRWAYDGEPQVLLKILDPSKVYDWIGSVWYSQQDLGIPLSVEKGRLGDSIGLLVDARSIPTPVEPLFFR